MRGAAERRGERRARLAVALALAALVLASAAFRVQKALADPNFDAARPAAVLKSDPALLYWMTERVLEAGGAPPAGWRAERRVQWPDAVDLPATFSVGQEFLVAWAWLACGGGRPLHVFALWPAALLAALAGVGAYLIAREAGGARGWGLYGALLWFALPAAYRTVGFVLVREDLAFPLFALHLGLALRARRVGGAGAWLAAGAALAAALATWHAMPFLVALEVAAAWAWFLATRDAPLGGPGARWVALPVALACATVPVLRATAAPLSPALIGGAALWVACGLHRGQASLRRPLLGAAAVVALGLALRAGFADALAAHGHVFEVLGAKLAHLGVKPRDPSAVSFDARLLWQSSFETLRPADAGWALGASLLALPLLVARRTRAAPEADPARRRARGLVALTALASLPAAWLVLRVVILPGLLLPAALAGALARWPTTPARRLAALALAAQLALFVAWDARTRAGTWYLPPGRNEELARLCAALPAHVPEGEAVAADFVNSTAVLAATGRPILLQPKYETAAARRRAERFLELVFRGTPAELRRALLEEFDCRYVLFDRFVLDFQSRWTAGETLPIGVFAPGTAAAAFLSQDPARLTGVPGFELLYRSPPDILQSNGAPYDLFRLYRLTPE